MSNQASPVDVEAGIDRVSTDNIDHDLARNSEDGSYPLEDNDGEHIESSNNEQMVSENYKEINALVSNENGLVNEQSVPLPGKTKACFLLSYSTFLILYIVFFFLIASTYPLEPVCHIDGFYLPVFDKISSNITQEMKDLVYLKLKFNNRNELISVSYDDFLNITIYYLPYANTSIYFANCTLPGFYQHKLKPKSAVVQTPAPGLSDLLQIQEEFTTMFFRVDLEISLRFHCRELGKYKHRFLLTADVEISLETGTTFDDTVKMSELTS